MRVQTRPSAGVMSRISIILLIMLGVLTSCTTDPSPSAPKSPPPVPPSSTSLAAPSTSAPASTVSNKGDVPPDYLSSGWTVISDPDIQGNVDGQAKLLNRVFPDADLVGRAYLGRREAYGVLTIFYGVSGSADPALMLNVVGAPGKISHQGLRTRCATLSDGFACTTAAGPLVSVTLVSMHDEVVSVEDLADLVETLQADR